MFSAMPHGRDALVKTAIPKKRLGIRETVGDDYGGPSTTRRPSVTAGTLIE
jgi:hypothetical protein